MDFHAMTEKEALGVLGTDVVNGLDGSEAEKRLKSVGKNAIAGKARPSLLRRFLSQFSDFMIITLILSAAISAGVSFFMGEGDLTDPVIILSIVILNAVIGVIQEFRAESAISALKKMTDPKATVLRGGKAVKIDSELVALGDILLLSPGDMIPADARIIECSSLCVNESSLTGESAPVKKSTGKLGSDSHLPDRLNCVYSSTLVTEGHAKAAVFATGMDTQVGRLAGIINVTDFEDTPLSKRLASVGKTLALGALFACFIVFLLGLIRRFDPFFMFMTSVSLAVAAIPEGLPAIVTVMLAMGVSSMAKKKAVVRNLPAVETLGSATVICSDKTGTLTEGNMKVTGETDPLSLMLAALCSDSDGTLGSGTENSIVSAYGDVAHLREKYPRADEIPFSSERKCMTTLNRSGGEYFTVTKGAFDVIISKCAFFLKGGEKKPLTRFEKERIIAECERAAEGGLRVLGVAAKRTGRAIDSSGLTFVGTVYLSDPLRPEVKKAVATCKRAGIEVAVITGDHKGTATKVASELKIGRGEVLTGQEISALSDDQLCEKVKKVRVFARVLPEHKVRIVNAFKKNGHIVAMTGDGVNDAPALKAADIGCAMGKTGTEVAKSAADMVLSDDNFATIVEAVREGRIIYRNIKNAIHFLISSNIGEILVMLLGILMGFGAPLYPIELLWVNLITDSLPALALGMDFSGDGVMENKPVDPKKGFFSDGLGADILFEGCLIGALSLAAYSFGRFSVGGGEAAARTMAFCTLSLSQLVHAFDVRTNKSVFKEKNHNPYLFLAAALGVILQCSVCVIEPLASVFRTTFLSAKEWIATALFSLCPLAVSELSKIDKGSKREYNL